VSKFCIFYETLKIFNDFSLENHGHGDHEHGVRRGVFGGRLSFKIISAGVRFCILQENPYFWVPTIKVQHYLTVSQVGDLDFSAGSSTIKVQHYLTVSQVGDLDFSAGIF
jgi:hypothetical protein